MDRRTYRFGESTLTVTNERIVDSQADVIVSTGSTALRGSGGLSKALIERAGGAVSGDTAKFDNLRIGDVVVTSAGLSPGALALSLHNEGARYDPSGSGHENQPATNDEAVLRTGRLARCQVDLVPAPGWRTRRLSG